MNKFVEQFAAQLGSANLQIPADVCDFADWQTQRQGRTFIPAATDDVAIRSYLLHLKLSGARRSILQRTITSLKRFYESAWANGLIPQNPFESFDFDRPLLDREQIK